MGGYNVPSSFTLFCAELPTDPDKREQFLEEILLWTGLMIYFHVIFISPSLAMDVEPKFVFCYYSDTEFILTFEGTKVYPWDLISS